MSRRTGINIAIGVAIGFFLFIGFGFAFSGSEKPEPLVKSTGIVAKFKQYDTTWSDYIFASSPSSYFNVWFEDGSFFEATGTYSMIDRALFEDLQVGDEITVTYKDEGFWGPDKIYGIEYRGKIYLSVDEVLRKYEDNEQPMFIFGMIIVALTVIVGGVILFIYNYRFGKKK